MKILSHYLLCLYNPPHYCHFIFDIQFFVVYMSNKIFTHSLPMRYADFPTLVDALDYAALSSAGMNFYDRRCQRRSTGISDVKSACRSWCERLLSLNLKKGDRVALIAETSRVCRGFCLPVCRLSRRPVGDSNGRRSAGFGAKLQGLLASCQPAAIITGDEWLPLVNAATHNNNPELHVLSHTV